MGVQHIVFDWTTFFSKFSYAGAYLRVRKNAYVRTTQCRKYRVLSYIIWFLEEKKQLIVIVAHFSAVACSETIFSQGFALLTPIWIVTAGPHLEWVVYKMTLCMMWILYCTVQCLYFAMLYKHRFRYTKKNSVKFNSYLPISFNICFGCSKEPSHWDGSFEYPQHMFWLRNKKINNLVNILN